MLILGIESSCDETAACVVQKTGNAVKILSSITATSAGLHAKTGGVIPEQAARKQLEVIIPVIDLALKEAKVNPLELSAIAVTTGPGLIGSLLVGVETAKTLSVAWGKPIVPVNHLLAHIYSTWIQTDSANFKTPSFPALALVVSGGHTDMVLVVGHGKLKWLGGTRDDAAGEAFDKTARLLGIAYPGGPNLAHAADSFRAASPKKELALFPRPMIKDNNFDFSFSGLKTAVLNHISKLASDSNLHLSDYKVIAQNKSVTKKIPELAAEIQEAIVDVLVAKTIKAAQKHNVKSIIVGGGVSANGRLKEKFAQEIAGLNFSFHVPQPKLATDNAEMIAAFAALNFKPKDWEEIDANPQLNITG